MVVLGTLIHMTIACAVDHVRVEGTQSFFACLLQMMTSKSGAVLMTSALFCVFAADAGAQSGAFRRLRVTCPLSDGLHHLQRLLLALLLQPGG